MSYNFNPFTGNLDYWKDIDAFQYQGFYNMSLSSSVSSNQLTVTLKAADGSDLSAANPAYVWFKNIPAATGTMTRRTITSNLTLVLFAGDTLSHLNNGVSNMTFHIAWNTTTNALALGVSAQEVFSDTYQNLVRNNNITTPATIGNFIYTNSIQGNFPTRMIGMATSQQPTAGQWTVNLLSLNMFTSTYNRRPDTFVVYQQTVSQALPTGGAGTVINFNSRLFDFNSWVTTGTGWRFDPTRGGHWVVVANVFLQAASLPVGTTITLRTRLSAGAVSVPMTRYISQTTTSLGVPLVATAPVRIRGGEYLQLEIFHDAGFTLNTDIANQGVRVMIYRVHNAEF